MATQIISEFRCNQARLYLEGHPRLPRLTLERCIQEFAPPRLGFLAVLHLRSPRARLNQIAHPFSQRGSPYSKLKIMLGHNNRCFLSCRCTGLNRCLFSICSGQSIHVCRSAEKRLSRKHLLHMSLQFPLVFTVSRTAQIGPSFNSDDKLMLQWLPTCWDTAACHEQIHHGKHTCSTA